MATLAIDTSMRACAVAVSAEHWAREAMQRGQAERLVPMVAEVLGRAGLAFGDLARVVVTVGPGSFTGIRVGLATARGLGLALGVPVLGVSTLDVLWHAGVDDLSQEEVEAIVNGTYGLPDPRAMLRMADDEGLVRPPEPLYLRGPGISQPRTPPRVLAD